jgi:phage terminase small subunit
VARKLSPKQQRFVDEYLKDLNGTQACIRAGYSRKFAAQSAHILLEKIIVHRAIRKRLAQRSARLEVNAQKVLEEYAKIAFANMDDFATWGDNSVTLVASHDLDRRDKAAVKQISERVTQFGTAVTIKLHDKRGALDALAKHLGICQEFSLADLERFLAILPRGLADGIRRLVSPGSPPAPREIEQHEPGPKPG